MYSNVNAFYNNNDNLLVFVIQELTHWSYDLTSLMIIIK